jgi:thiol-disulfide isomerase/thioredoxin
MPDFTLPDTVSGQIISSEAFAGKITVVMFLCRHCPYVVHVRDEIGRVAHDYAGRGVAFVAVGSNDARTHPDDAPERLAEMAVELGYDFPFCYDESQELAKAFDAACTPDFFVYDKGGKLAYRGQLDGTRPGGSEPDGRDLRRALDALCAGEAVPGPQVPSTGCNIKWKPGNAPGR